MFLWKSNSVLEAQGSTPVLDSQSANSPFESTLNRLESAQRARVCAGLKPDRQVQERMMGKNVSTRNFSITSTKDTHTHAHTSSESNTTYLAYVILQTLECAGDRKTQFIFICRITRFSYFLSHHIPPQAVPA